MGNDLGKYKAILFDHDDTLVNTIDAKWAQHKYIAKTFYDKELTNADIQPHWGKPLSILLKLLYTTDNIDIAMSYNIATREQFPKRLFNDTLKTLKNLKKMGIRIGLLTATVKLSLQHDFATLKIPPKLFDYVQTEDDTNYHKPDPKVFQPALSWLETLEIHPSQALYVGDSLKDMQAAVGAGLQFIGVTTGLTTIQEFRDNGVQTIERLSDLILLSV